MGNDVNAYDLLLARLNQLDSQVKAFMQAASLDLEDVHNRIEILFTLLDREEGEERAGGEERAEERDKEETLSLSHSTHSLSPDNEIKDLLRELIQEVKELKGVGSQGVVVSKVTNGASNATPKKRGRPRKNPIQEVVSEGVEKQPVADTTPQSFYAWEGTFPDPREYKAVE